MITATVWLLLSISGDVWASDKLYVVSMHPTEQACRETLEGIRPLRAGSKAKCVKSEVVLGGTNEQIQSWR